MTTLRAAITPQGTTPVQLYTGTTAARVNKAVAVNLTDAPVHFSVWMVPAGENRGAQHLVVNNRQLGNRASMILAELALLVFNAQGGTIWVQTDTAQAVNFVGAIQV